ncbi:MAG: GDSL-type esterase/lipase family protein [Verrucomicrobiota bacterium]
MFPQNRRSFLLHSTLTLTLLASSLCASAEITVKDGQKIGFLGDSITAQGWSNPGGYVRLVIAGLKANGINAEPIPAGVSGHKSNQMLARLGNDVLSKKPNWMTLSCGVNDVWHGLKGVPLDDAQAASATYEMKPGEPEKGTYQKNITAIIEAAKAAGAQPVILTATVIKEDLNSPENAKLAPYNDFLRKVAQEKKLPIADLYSMFQEKLKAVNTPDKKVLTSDGVHMNQDGNKLMAQGVLKAFGLNDSELLKAEAAWAPLIVEAEEYARKAAEAKAEAAAKKAAEQKAAGAK